MKQQKLLALTPMKRTYNTHHFRRRSTAKRQTVDSLVTSSPLCTSAAEMSRRLPEVWWSLGASRTSYESCIDRHWRSRCITTFLVGIDFQTRSHCYSAQPAYLHTRLCLLSTLDRRDRQKIVRMRIVVRSSLLPPLRYTGPVEPAFVLTSKRTNR